MTIIYAATTSLVNPPDVTPILTLTQLYAGLERKAREPQLFLSVIDTCVVLEDDGTTVLREVRFKDGGGVGMAHIIGAKVQERITHIAPLSGSALHTFQSVNSPSRVLNIVSTGPKGVLNLTFTFEWDHPEIMAGSEQEKAKQVAYQSTAPRGVEGTLKAIREMVVEGIL